MFQKPSLYINGQHITGIVTLLINNYEETTSTTFYSSGPIWLYVQKKKKLAVVS